MALAHIVCDFSECDDITLVWHQWVLVLLKLCVLLVEQLFVQGHATCGVDRYLLELIRDHLVWLELILFDFGTTVS